MPKTPIVEAKKAGSRKFTADGEEFKFVKENL